MLHKKELGGTNLGLNCYSLFAVDVNLRTAHNANKIHACGFVKSTLNLLQVTIFGIICV